MKSGGSEGLTFLKINEVFVDINGKATAAKRTGREAKYGRAVALLLRL